MHEKFNVTACIKLEPTEKKSLNICEVCDIVGNSFAEKLNSMYSEALFTCTKELGTSQFTMVSMKITPMPGSGEMSVTVNVLLTGKKADEDQTKNYRKVEFRQGSDKVKNLDIHRLVKYMEVKARQEHGDQFKSLIHIRVIPVEKDDATPNMF